MRIAAASLNLRRAGLSVTALLAAAAVLAVAAAPARAGTWYINPTIRNETQSPLQEPCGGGHSDWAGCAILTASGVDDGEFTADRYGGTGGRHTLPAECDPLGSYCGGSGTSVPNIDEPSFIAPHEDEGADGYFVYTMPDGSHFGMAAQDNEEGIHKAAAFAQCGGANGESDSFACLARYPSGTETEPENSPFDPEFIFTPVADAQYTAAGQRCTVPEGATNYTCAAGKGCHGTRSECQQYTGGSLSPTDPGEYMYLNFYDAGRFGSVTILDQAVYEDRTGTTERCTVSAGQQCALWTEAGESNAIQVTDEGGEAELEVLTEAEVTEDQFERHEGEGYDEGRLILAEEEAMLEGFEGGEVVGGGGGPVLTDLHVSTGLAGGAARLSTRPTALTVSYRDSSSGTTVFTFAREQGTRWVTLAGRHAKAISDFYSAHRHRRRELSGHLRHRDVPGMNRLHFSMVGGHPLTPGRYRVTAVALKLGRAGKPVSTTFRVGPRG